MGCGCSGLGCTEPLEASIPRSRAAAAAEIKADPAMLPFFFSAADGDKYWSYEHALVDRESLVLVDLGDAKHAATAGQRKGDGRRSLSDHAIALAAIACPKLKYLAICGCDFSGGRIEELPDLPVIEGVAGTEGNDAIWRYAGATKPAKRLPPRRRRRSVSSDGFGSSETPHGDSPTMSIGRLGDQHTYVDHVTSGSSVSGGDLGCYLNDGARVSLPFYSDGSVSGGDGSGQPYSGSLGLPQPDAPLFEHFTSDSPPPQSKSQNGGFLAPGETDARRSMTNHPGRQGGGVKMHSFMRPNASITHPQAHIGPSFGGRSVSSAAGLLGGGSLATKDPDRFDGFQHGARGMLFDTGKKKKKPKLSAAYCGALEYGGNGEYGGGGLARNALLSAAIGDNNARRVSRTRPLRRDAAPGGPSQGDVSHSGGYSPSHGRPPSAVRSQLPTASSGRSVRSGGRSTTDSPPPAESTGRDTTSQRSGESAGMQMLASFDSPSSAELSPRSASRSHIKSATPPSHAGDFPEAPTLLPPAQKHLHPVSPIERDGRQVTLALSITGVEGDDAIAFSVRSPTPGVGDGSSRSRSLCSSSHRTPSVGSPLPEPDAKGGRCRRRTVRQSGLDFATAMTISVPDRLRGGSSRSGQSSPRRASPASPGDYHQVKSNGTAPEATTSTLAQARPTDDSHKDGPPSAATTATTADTPFVDAGIETAAPAPRLSFAKPETGAPSNAPRGSGGCTYLLGRQTASPQWAQDSFWNSESDVAADTRPPAAVACAGATAGRLTPTGGGMPDWLLKSTTTVGTSENESSGRIPSVKDTDATDDEQARTSNEDDEVPKRNETNSLEIPRAEETCIGQLEHVPSASELLRRGTSALFGRSETSVHTDADVHAVPMPTQRCPPDDDEESGPIVDVALHTECPPPPVLSSTQAATKAAKKRRASVSFPQLAVTSDATDDGGPSGADSPASGEDGEMSGRSARRHSFVEKMRESMAAVGVSKDVLDQSFDPGSLSNSFRRKSPGSAEPVAGMKAIGGDGSGGSSSNADASAVVDRTNGATLQQERPPPMSDVIASPDAERRTSDTFDQSETTIRVKFLKKGGGRKMPDSMPFALAITTLKDTQRHSITVNVNAPVLGHTETADHDPSCGEYSDVIRAVNASCRASVSHQSPNGPPCERPVSARQGHHLLSRLSQPNGRLAHTVSDSEENDGVMTVWATDAELPLEAIPRSVSVLSDAMQTLRTVQAEEAATELQQQQFSHSMQTHTSAGPDVRDSSSGGVGSGHPLQSPPPPHDALLEELPGFVSDDKVSNDQLEQSGNRSSSRNPAPAHAMEQSMGRSTLAVEEQAVSGSLSQVASELVLTQSDRRSSSASARTASVHSIHSMGVRETASALAEQNLVAGGTTDSQRASSVDTRSLQQDSVSTMPYPNGALTPLDGSRRSDDFHSGPSSPQMHVFRQGDLLAGGAQPNQHAPQQFATVAGKQRPTDSPVSVAASGRPVACVPVPVLLATGSSEGTAEEPAAIPSPTNGSKPTAQRDQIAGTTATQSNVVTSSRDRESVGADAAKVAPPSPVDSPTKRKRTTVVTISGDEDNYSPRSDRRSVVSKPSAVKQRGSARPFGMPSLSLLAKHAAIEELYVANCVNFAPAAMVHFLRNGGGRKLLAVSFEEIYATEAVLLAVAKHCPELEVLHLQGVESAAITVGVMRRLAAECPQLDEIVVDSGMYGRSLILELFEAGP